jgi:hypothetical protein
VDPGKRQNGAQGRHDQVPGEDGEHRENSDRPESPEPGGDGIVGRTAQHVMQCSRSGNATISCV